MSYSEYGRIIKELSCLIQKTDHFPHNNYKSIPDKTCMGDISLGRNVQNACIKAFGLGRHW